MTNRARHSDEDRMQGVPKWDALPIKCEQQPEVMCSVLPSQSQPQDRPRRHLEKLRSKIVTRRRVTGQGDVEPDPEPVSYQMTQEELEKRERRKEQNRRAARKCREKKRAVQGSFAQEFSRMQSENEQLEGEITRLRHEKDTLTKVLQAHVQGGGCRHFTNATPHLVSGSGTTCEVPFSLADAGRNKIEDYLLGLSPLEPSETFIDLEQIIGQDSDLTYSEQRPATGHHGNTSLAEDTFLPCPDQKLVNYFPPLSSRDRYSVSSVTSSVSDLSTGFAVCDQTIQFGPFDSCSQPEGGFPSSPPWASGTCFHDEPTDRDGRSLAGDPRRAGRDGASHDVNRGGQRQVRGHLAFYAAVVDSTDGEDDDVFDVNSTITSDQVYQQYSSGLGD